MRNTWVDVKNVVPVLVPPFAAVVFSIVLLEGNDFSLTHFIFNDFYKVTYILK